jgi:hypothetical protein
MHGRIDAGTAVWQDLLPEGSTISDAFYFAVVTFLTIGYGDIAPASTAGKVFFIIYTIASLIVQLTVVGAFINSAMSFSPSHPVNKENMVRARPLTGAVYILLQTTACYLHGFCLRNSAHLRVFSLSPRKLQESITSLAQASARQPGRRLLVFRGM